MRAIACLLVLLFSSLGSAAPNVLVVITDDQGFGDLGVHGNPILKTPELDAFAKQSVWLKNFTVCPVCSPTRSALLTGRYNYRTGVVDTFIGRSLMRPDVPTLPEGLAKAGYRTGLFGKWHLGDNYPLRPEDRGFQETLWSRGGGLAQPSDHPDADSKTAYFDPRLVKNGKEIVAKGYCTDAFTDGAIEFIRKDSKEPFFAYVAYNAPHGPYQVPEEAAAPYRKLKLGADAFPNLGQPWAGPKVNEREIADAYGMIANIDWNFGRLMKALDERKIADDTIVIFLTDNGPGGVRFNSGLRNRKGTVYDGGIRVPCYVRWPKELKAGHVVDLPTAHIDLAPTLLAAAGTRPTSPVDGRDVGPLLKNGSGNWPGRTIFTQWHRGDAPEKYRAFSARGPKHKLVQAAGVQPNAKWQPKYELFDLANDPFEQTDLAAKLPDEVAQLKREYERWFDDVTKLGFEPARIHVGSDQEPVTRLSRQDWRGPKAGWTPESVGQWEIFVERDGEYEIALRSKSPFTTASIEVRDEVAGFKGDSQQKTKTIPITLPKGNVTLKPTVGHDGKTWGPEYVELKFVGKK
jgi:arylsulfatase A-like enzyme